MGVGVGGCVCACVCARARVCVCVCARARVCTYARFDRNGPVDMSTLTDQHVTFVHSLVVQCLPTTCTVFHTYNMYCVSYLQHVLCFSCFSEDMYRAQLKSGW